MNRMHMHDSQTYRMEPDCYDGERSDQMRPTWITSYPKEGDENIGATLDLKLSAPEFPPGTRIIIQVPMCPNCTIPADYGAQDFSGREWPDCECGFSWEKWAESQYS